MKREYINKAEKILNKYHHSADWGIALDYLYRLHIKAVKKLIKSKQKELNYTQKYECGGILNEMLKELVK